MQTNTSSLSTTVQPFIVPRREQTNPLSTYLYTENYIDQPAKNKCPKCKKQRIKRTCAQGKGSRGGLCFIAFDFCPVCRRVKPATPFQSKRIGLVTDIQPLTKEYVFIQNKFQQARTEGRRVIDKREYDVWCREFTENETKGGCTNAS